MTDDLIDTKKEDKDFLSFILVAGKVFYSDSFGEDKGLLINTLVTTPYFSCIRGADLVRIKASLAKQAFDSLNKQGGNVENIKIKDVVIISIIPLGQQSKKDFQDFSEIENELVNKPK